LRPVGVELDKEVPVLDDPQEDLQVLLEERFAAADTDPSSQP